MQNTLLSQWKGRAATRMVRCLGVLSSLYASEAVDCSKTLLYILQEKL